MGRRLLKDYFPDRYRSEWARRVRSLRKRMVISQRDLATQLGVSPGMVAQIEMNMHPSHLMIQKIEVLEDMYSVWTKYGFGDCKECDSRDELNEEYYCCRCWDRL